MWRARAKGAGRASKTRANTTSQRTGTDDDNRDGGEATREGCVMCPCVRDEEGTTGAEERGAKRRTEARLKRDSCAQPVPRIPSATVLARTVLRCGVTIGGRKGGREEVRERGRGGKRGGWGWW